MVEHSTADREVPGSNPGAPYQFIFYLKKNNKQCSYWQLLDIFIYVLLEINAIQKNKFYLSWHEIAFLYITQRERKQTKGSLSNFGE